MRMNSSEIRHVVICFLILVSSTGFAKPNAIELEQTPPASQASLEAFSHHTDVRSAKFLGWLDQSILIVTRFDQTRQLHIVDKPLGARSQITFANEPVRFGITGKSHQSGVIYGLDDAGSENYQLYHYDPLSSISRKLTNNRARHTDPVWSNDGRFVAFSTTVRNGKDTDIHILDLESNDERPILQQSGTWFVMDWSADDRKLLVAKFTSINQINLYEVDIRSGIRHLIESQSNFAAVSQTMAKYSPNGQGLWFLSDFETEYRTLRYRSKEREQSVTSHTNHIPHDITMFEISPDGRLVYFVANQDGYDKLYRLEVKRNKISIIEDQSGINNVLSIIHSIDFSLDGSQLAVSGGSPSMPGDVFVINMRKLQLERWTKSELGELINKNLIHPSLINFTTFDLLEGQNVRRTIPAFFYKPYTGGPHPVLIFLHGGPENQARPVFRPILNYLLNELNIAVIYPNYRGSTGYGKTYTKLDNGYKRKDAVRDIKGLLDWVSTQPELDNSRIAVMGGSYGGYLALSSLIEYPNSLKAGISMVGISDFVSLLQNTKAYRQDIRRQEYGDERDHSMRVYLNSISPLKNAKRIKSPLFVIHGRNDPRVHISESRSIVDAVRGNGQEVWYMVANNEGHGFYRRENREYYYALVADFLRKNLIGEQDKIDQVPSL